MADALGKPNQSVRRRAFVAGSIALFAAPGVQLDILKAGTEGEIDAAFATLVQHHTGALLVAGVPFSRREQLVALAERYSVPVIYDAREFAEAGGLISYGASRPAAWHQAGIYLGKILHGAKPADLPVYQSTQLRAGRQPQDRQGARPHSAAIDPCPRRRADRMRRRELIVALGGATIAGCRSARAQRRALPLVAFLSPRTFAANIDAFRRGLRELGYVEGQNIALEVRSAEGDYRRLPALAAELVSLKPDVIVTNSEPAIRAVKEVADTIPIVMS